MAMQQPADVLVVFGITGDLAKVMTFRSLYRLERRCCSIARIVGVAVDDWDIDQLRQRARDSIVGTGEDLDETVFERFAARLSYVQATFPTREPTSRSRRRSAPRSPPSSISRYRRSCSARSSRGSPRPG
jgi:glucose-6-phosphate 1-dehydrogenase